MKMRNLEKLLSLKDTENVFRTVHKFYIAYVLRIYVTKYVQTYCIFHAYVT